MDTELKQEKKPVPQVLVVPSKKPEVTDEPEKPAEPVVIPPSTVIVDEVKQH